ncbi:MAG: hypothetical protein FWG85_00705 [Bacteroidetes bacterium]|nr:hypothetical protein [Bacteroidota bacterium]
MKEKIKQKLVCKICGKEFETIRNKKYCSKECTYTQIKLLNASYVLKRKTAIKPIIKVCECCGKEFETTIRNKKYCNPKCCKHNKKPNAIRICKICGKEFETNRKKKYCSKECAYTQIKILSADYMKRKATLKPIILVCKICGKEFETIRKKKYCSEQCYGKNKPIIVKKCNVCGKEFETIRKKKYCSKKCSTIVYKKIYPNRFCKHCGKEFKVSIVNKKYCSHECCYIHIHNIGKNTIKICDNCGKEFETHKNRKRFCCIKCGQEYHTSLKLIPNKIHIICEYCGKVFISEQGTRRKYCSKECSIKSGNMARPRKIRTCEVCGVMFASRNEYKRYCCTNCHKTFLKLGNVLV